MINIGRQNVDNYGNQKTAKVNNTRNYMKNSDLFVNYNKYNTGTISVLNRVSSRGDSEESNSRYA